MLAPLVTGWCAGEVGRTTVEALCGFRPELVDALWKCDMEWSTQRVPNEGRRDFIVTSNGSFFRPEVLHYINEELQAYKPTKKKCVLIPCAADKPYPSPLHQAVLDILPADYDLITATGVLGLVPQALWPVMPYYDSGVPYEWRLFNIAQWYFSRHAYHHVIAYTDFYSYTIAKALAHMPYLKLDFVDEPVVRKGYLDLLAPERLEKLRTLFIKGEQRELMYE
jgi:predicted RNA-binding protein